MKTLRLIDCGASHKLLTPSDELLNDLESSSLSIITDFTQVKPLVIDIHASAIEAERLMLMTHVRLKLVTDHEGTLVGVVSYQDLDGQEVMKQVANGFPREELTVADFMVPTSDLTGLLYQDLTTASIRDVLKTLGDSPRQHCLVIDNDAQKIRGIVSASNVVRLLKLPMELAHGISFRDVFRKLKTSALI